MSPTLCSCSPWGKSWALVTTQENQQREPADITRMGVNRKHKNILKQGTTSTTRKNGKILIKLVLKEASHLYQQQQHSGKSANISIHWPPLMECGAWKQVHLHQELLWPTEEQESAWKLKDIKDDWCLHSHHHWNNWNKAQRWRRDGHRAGGIWTYTHINKTQLEETWMMWINIWTITIIINYVERSHSVEKSSTQQHQVHHICDLWLLHMYITVMFSPFTTVVETGLTLCTLK